MILEPTTYYRLEPDGMAQGAFVHIVGDKVFLETETDSVMLSVEQAKRLSYFINDRLVRVVDLSEIHWGEE
jgi:hypothetical protein